jgi:hypothetical protein
LAGALAASAGKPQLLNNGSFECRTKENGGATISLFPAKPPVVQGKTAGQPSGITGDGVGRQASKLSLYKHRFCIS